MVPLRIGTTAVDEATARAAVHALSVVPTTIICGTADKMTSVDHSRTLHARIEGSDLIECAGAGHLVIMERHDQVNAALDQLLAAATAQPV